MKLEHYSLERLQREIGEIVWKYLACDDYKVYFFGSRVMGNSSAWSDIDVGIEGLVTIPPVIMAKIRDEITALPMLYNIDIVDMRAATPAFRHIAKQQIEFITHE